MPSSRVIATVTKTTPASVEAVCDSNAVGGLTGVDITLWYTDTAGLEPVPYEVGDTIEIVVRPVKGEYRQMVRVVERNIGPSQHEAAVG